MVFVHPARLIAAAAMIVAAAACTRQPTVARTVVFGTEAVITVNDLPAAAAEEAIGEVFLSFRRMHKQFHAWREGELFVVNRAIADNALPITVSAPMAKMLSLSAKFSRDSGDLFNPAIGRLVSLWGFHADSPPAAPPPAREIAFLTARPINLNQMKLERLVLRNLPPRVQLDFGAVAKGAALDEARDILRRRGVDSALINIGGNILALGDNRGRAWTIELRPARQAAAVGKIELRDGEAIATSGGGERFFMHDNRRYHHIIDPRDGYPARMVAAATVISGDRQNAGAISDAAATALVIANDEEAENIRRNFAIILAVRVFSDGETRPTAAMARRLKRQKESP